MKTQVREHLQKGVVLYHYQRMLNEWAESEVRFNRALEDMGDLEPGSLDLIYDVVQYPKISREILAGEVRAMQIDWEQKRPPMPTLPPHECN